MNRWMVNGVGMDGWTMDGVVFGLMDGCLDG